MEIKKEEAAEAPAPAGDGNETARVEQAAELGIIDEKEKVELLSGLNMGFGEAPAPVDTGDVTATGDATVVEDEIQIGDRTFTNQADAIAYAKQMEADRLSHDAYQQGLLDSQSQAAGNPAAAVAPEAGDLNDKFYEDPTKFIGEQTTAAAEAGYKKAMDEIGKTQAREKLWEKFYTNNPELKSKKTLVEKVLDDEWTLLGPMKDADAAMKILAKKTNDLLKSWIDESKPSEELPNAKQIASPGGQTQVTPQKVEEKEVDFTTQLLQHQEKRMLS